jgi:hypothetical protein
MALCLSKEVVNNAIADLSIIEKKNGGMLNGSTTDVSTVAPLLANNKKRKHSSVNGSLQEYDAGGGLGVEVPKKCAMAPISLRVAALEALETLITVVCIFCLKYLIFFPFINLFLPLIATFVIVFVLIIGLDGKG